MWLLGTQDLVLREIFESDLEQQQGARRPCYRYAILSHRWETLSEEPRFEDFLTEKPSSPTVPVKRGFKKVLNFARVAKHEHKVDFVWVDTCCINKKSSAELQESIISMYSYYKRAAVCYVYLRDFNRTKQNDQDFIKSEWFTRGWTLQELLAPGDVRFYDCDWAFLGTKQTLRHLISAATGIQQELLSAKKQMQHFSVAQRMSWAAGRKTTRIEDRAYSLFGIFDVSMAVLYGEGSKSFLRLQQEILKSLDDPSIFLWKGLRRGFPGLLALSPDEFSSSGNVANLLSRQENLPYNLTSRGINGRMPLIPYTLDTYLMPLPCSFGGRPNSFSRAGIFIRRLYGNDQFARVSVCGEELMESIDTFLKQRNFTGLFIDRDISVRQNEIFPEDIDELHAERILGFRLEGELLQQSTSSAALYDISGTWSSESRIISLEKGSCRQHSVGSINIGLQGREIETIRFGFDADYNPVIYLAGRNVQYYTEEVEDGTVREDFRYILDHNPAPRLAQFSGESFINATPSLTGRWARELVRADGRKIALMSQNVKGFWALKADRIAGLDTYIALELRHADGKIARHKLGRVRVFRTMVAGHLVWNLTVDELQPMLN